RAAAAGRAGGGGGRYSGGAGRFVDAPGQPRRGGCERAGQRVADARPGTRAEPAEDAPARGNLAREVARRPDQQQHVVAAARDSRAHGWIAGGELAVPERRALTLFGEQVRAAQRGREHRSWVVA